MLINRDYLAILLASLMVIKRQKSSIPLTHWILSILGSIIIAYIITAFIITPYLLRFN